MCELELEGLAQHLGRAPSGTAAAKGELAPDPAITQLRRRWRQTTQVIRSRCFDWLGSPLEILWRDGSGFTKEAK